MQLQIVWHTSYRAATTNYTADILNLQRRRNLIIWIFRVAYFICMRVIQCDSLVQSHCYETKFVCLKGRISSRLVSNRLWIGCQTHLVYPVCDPARQSLYFHAFFLVSTISFSYTLTTAREACETAVGLLMFSLINIHVYIWMNQET